MQQAWQRLLQAADRRGIASLPVDAAALKRLREHVDLSAAAIELLGTGWPIRPLTVGTTDLLPDVVELTEALQRNPGWPRDILPLAAPQPAAPGLDLQDGSVVVVTPGTPHQRAAGWPDLPAFMDDVTTWLELVPPESAIVVQPRCGVPDANLAALTARLGASWRERWLFRTVQSLGELRAALSSELLLNQRTARVATVIIALSPLLGWGVGTLAHQPWAGVALALLVVGGVPSLLLLQAQRRAAALAKALRALPPT